jgi:hypothetical protein
MVGIILVLLDAVSLRSETGAFRHGDITGSSLLAEINLLQLAAQRRLRSELGRGFIGGMRRRLAQPRALRSAAGGRSGRLIVFHRGTFAPSQF